MRYDKVQLLTPTGCRPSSWALCERWMRAQTWSGEVLWLIVDDGPEPQPITFARDGWELRVIRPQPYWRAGQNTQARNLLAGIRAASVDHPLMVIEDDDYYTPEYLEHMLTLLGDAAGDDADALVLCGETQACYYNIRTRRGRRLRNDRHASLCSTAMTGATIPYFRVACERRPRFIDLDLWAMPGLGRATFASSRPLSVGIKGMPGRAGIGMGHSARFQAPPDQRGRLLHKWIGDDAAHYLGGT